MPSISELYQADRHNDVVSLYMRSDWRPQVDFDKIFVVAASYFKLGDYRESYPLLKAIQTSYVGDVGFLSLYAATCRHIGQLVESQTIFLKALNIDPDNIGVLNNYSNLLIDLHDYDQACTILRNIISSNPEYSDARANYDRVRQILELQSVKASAESLLQSSSFNSESSSCKSSSSRVPSSSAYFDPLLFAFTEEEVRRTAPFRPVPSDNRSGALAALANSFPSQDRNAVAADQLNLASRAVREGNPSFALEACSYALSGLDTNSELYSCVGDAYLSQKNFVMAELYFLHSIALGSNSFKNNFNLASLACMKRDFGLSEYYLGIANSLDRSNQLVKNLKMQIIKLRHKYMTKGSFSFTNQTPYDSNAANS